MIVRETPSGFVCITQHDHARLAAQLAEQWPLPHFPGAGWRPAVLLAVEHHDRAWLPLDAAPNWNEQAQVPHSFLDYPLAPKLRHYGQGITETEQLAPYAGLLCSQHYTSFFQAPAHPVETQQFVLRETRRQHRLLAELGLTTPEKRQDLAFHLQLLQFTDRLSLYFCLNEPGASKAAEHPWYRAGIPFSDWFPFTDGQLIQAAWRSSRQVQVHPFPFADSFAVSLRFKVLPKPRLAELGLAECFRRAPVQQEQFWLTS